MKSAPGTYALILKCNSTASVQVGGLGEIEFKPGYYIYIGSAFGPGGVRGRVSRHLREDKPRHWHIDYLYKHVSPLGVWYSYEPEHLEHMWAQSLHNASGYSPIQGFGCSDCRCFSHLFHTSTNPDFDSFANVVGSKVQKWEI
jgi:Uri superfamily endonuclease